VERSLDGLEVLLGGGEGAMKVDWKIAACAEVVVCDDDGGTSSELVVAFCLFKRALADAQRGVIDVASDEALC